MLKCDVHVDYDGLLLGLLDVLAAFFDLCLHQNLYAQQAPGSQCNACAREIRLDVSSKSSVGSDMIKTVDNLFMNAGDDVSLLINNKVRLKTIKQGLTNRLFCAELVGGHEHYARKMLIRIYGKGTGLIINHDTELANYVRLAALYGHNQSTKSHLQHEQTPSLYLVFKNGFVYNYVEGEIVSAASLCREKDFEPHLPFKESQLQDLSSFNKNTETAFFNHSVTDFLASGYASEPGLLPQGAVHAISREIAFWHGSTDLLVTGNPARDPGAELDPQVWATLSKWLELCTP